jgi:N-acetylmuramoyl-L-alanine amidase
MARTWQYLIIHHSAGKPTDTVADIDQEHRKRGWLMIGYHFVIEREGVHGFLKAARPDAMTGAHCGVNKYNREGLGLCVAGYFHPGSPLSEKMQERLYLDVLGAVLHICKKYRIPAKHVLGHRDVKATACPGAWFPLQRLKDDVAKGLALVR